MKIEYKIKFYSLWNCGSGESKGSDHDSAVIRNHDGLPFIPGKTIKGILLDAMLDYKGIDMPDAEISEVFGKEPSLVKNHENDYGIEGCAYFSNANLPSCVADELNKNKSLVPFLFQRIASTSIENGVAKDKTLRTIEVTLPMTLYGEVDGIPNNFKSTIKEALGMVKRLGIGRNRGMGRCSLEIICANEKPDSNDKANI